jgi:hypothetical protein
MDQEAHTREDADRKTLTALTALTESRIPAGVFDAMAAALMAGFTAPYAPTFLMRGSGATSHERKARGGWLERTAR